MIEKKAFTLVVFVINILYAWLVNPIDSKSFCNVGIKRNLLFVLVFSLSLFLSVKIHAAPIVVLDEDYDGLTPGDPLPGWVAMQPWNDPTLPWVQNTNFNSPPNGAAVRNDFDVATVFDPIEGIVTLEVWMQCKLGSDTNCGIYFIPEGPLVHTGLVSKNETDRWFYNDNGIGVPFSPVSPTGHQIMIIYDTSTARYDLYLDGVLITSNTRWSGAMPGDRIIGVGTWSGRGGSGTTSYFDDLRLLYESIFIPVIVAIGDSITAGFQSGVLVESLQHESYAALIAAQAGIPFTLPLIEEPGSITEDLFFRKDCRPFNLDTDTLDKTDGNLCVLGGRKNPEDQPLNLAVPGANLKQIVQTRKKISNPLFELILQGPLYDSHIQGLKDGTQIAQAVQLNPSLVILWVGNNDALGAALKTNIKELTKTNHFQNNFDFLVQKLRETGADIAVANIPDVTVIPHLLRVGEVVGDLPFRVVANCPDPTDITANLEASIVPRNIQRGRGEHPTGSLVPLLNINTVFETFELCLSPLDGDENTFSRREILDPGEIAVIQNRITEFNQVIADIAERDDLALVDVNALLAGEDTSFTGGIFSLDGIHPSIVGHQLIANAFIEVINNEIIDRGEFGGFTTLIPLVP